MYYFETSLWVILFKREIKKYWQGVIISVGDFEGKKNTDDVSSTATYTKIHSFEMSSWQFPTYENKTFQSIYYTMKMNGAIRSILAPNSCGERRWK